MLNFFGKITEKTISKRKIIYFLLVLMFVFGAMMYQSITKSIFPNIKVPYVSIYTVMTGANAEDMEEMVTQKIEDELKDLKDVKEMKSTSSLGSSLVLIKFNEKSNVDVQIQRIQTKINNIRSKLPKEADVPIIEEYDVTKFPVISIEIKNDKPYDQLKQTVDDITKQIKRVQGVNKVERTGINLPQIQIQPYLDRMMKYKITNTDISSALEKSQANIPLGKIEMNELSYSLQTNNKLRSLEEIENIHIKSDGLRSISLKDIAKIQYVDEIGKKKTLRVKGEEQDAIISLLVYIDKSADMIRVNSEIKGIIEENNKTLTDSQKIAIGMDLSQYVKKSISDVMNSAMSGLLAVVVVLYFFINMEEAIIASMIIPITLVGSFALFNTFSLTLNVLSIMGLIIALGMLVDNAIIVIEMIDKNKERDKDLSLKEIIIYSANNIAPAIFSSTLTSICAFIPLAFLSGEEGSMIRVIPITMTISLVLSFIVSITVTPMLCYQFLTKETPTITRFKKIIYTVVIVIAAMYSFSNNWVLTKASFLVGFIALIVALYKIRDKKEVEVKDNRIGDYYQNVIKKIIASKKLEGGVFLIAGGLFVLSIYLLGSGLIKTESMPKVDSQSATGEIRLAKGSTFKDSNFIFNEIDTYLKSNPSILKYSCTIQEGLLSYNIELKPKAQRTMHSKNVLNQLTQFVNGLPNVSGEFKTDGDEVGSAPISIQLFGKNQSILIDEGKKVKEVLSNIPGVIATKLDFNYSEPTIKISIDRAQASRMQVEMSDITMQLRYVIAGDKIMTVKNNGNNVDVYLKYKEPFKNINSMLQMSIINQNGAPIPLIELIKITEERGISEIKHVDGNLSLAVNANFEKTTTVSEVVNKFESILKKDKILSEGVTYKVAGDFAKMNESYGDLTQKLIIAILLVYFVLLVQFNGYTQPLVILFCVPLAIIGVAIGYFLMRLNFSTLSFSGVVALVGVAVNNGIILIDSINDLRAKGVDKKEAIVISCGDRLKPILSTTITTIAGVLPLALYNEDYSQMAYALVFGLIGSTLMTLFVIPSALNASEDMIVSFKRAFKPAADK